jgi:glycopeptide antibiotics resistance protein
VGFSIYLTLLAWVVLWKLETPWVGEAACLTRPLKLLPFVATADAGASAPGEVLINFLLFVPFGLFMGTLAPTGTWWKTAATGFGVSLILETTQHLISIGSFDTTDLVVNTAGALTGWMLVAAIRRAAGPRAPVVLTRLCVAVSLIALLSVTAFIASPLHYGPQHDVVVKHATLDT